MKKLINNFHSAYLKSLVYGGLDGIVTTFAVVAGAAGANLAPHIALILGFANLVGDAISMAFGDYTSSAAKKELEENQKQEEIKLLKQSPERELEKIKDIYTKKGLEPEDASKLATIVCKKRNVAIEIILSNLGIPHEKGSPVKMGLYTFISFNCFGLIPLLSYVVKPLLHLSEKTSLILACILTACALFFLGSLKSFFTRKSFIFSGLQMLGVGGFTATAAYFVGYFIASLVH
ncbi:MAG: VIT1/CCC1 transporter family protein [bacterium]